MKKCHRLLSILLIIITSSSVAQDLHIEHCVHDDLYLEQSSAKATIQTNSYQQASPTLISNLNKVKAHILETAILTTTELETIRTAIESESIAFGSTLEIMELAFEVVALYESNYGPLFTTGTTTLGGFSRTATGYEFENVILKIMQYILDYSYTERNIKTYPTLFKNRLFETSTFFPGAVDQPANPSQRYTVKIDGTHLKQWGYPRLGSTNAARRPTGCYLAPGSIAEVTVPSSLVGIGATVLVGAHTWNLLTRKSTIKRMDGIAKVYEINSTTVTIGNPLGGGIYINIPNDIDLGILNIALKNVVRSPYFANTVANKTSVTDWQNTERLHQAPWTDLETERVMIQVPTSWINTVDDPTIALNDWDLTIDAIAEFTGRPPHHKTPLYAQADVIMRSNANAPGYPQANVIYNPYKDYDNISNHYLVAGPRDKRGYLATVLLHEQGHQEQLYSFRHETEAIVNFLWVAVHNKKFGVDLNTAFKESFHNLTHTIEQAAISWMVTENFRLGEVMHLRQFKYQQRGYAKYADIVRLFGWDALEKYYIDLNETYENGTFTYANNPHRANTDHRILKLSEAAGYDLQPLIHFWGVQADNFDDLRASIASSGVKKSAAIYDQLIAYKAIVPMSNNEFRNFGLQDFNENGILKSETSDDIYQVYDQTFLHTWWYDYNEEEGQAAVNEVQRIIDLYFPEGRPTDDVANNSEILSEADAYVWDKFASDNYGTLRLFTQLSTTLGDNRETYIKFDVSQLPTAVEKITFQLTLDVALEGVVTAEAFLVPDDSWVENSINWSNKPAATSTSLGNAIYNATTSTIEWDITATALAEASSDGMLSMKIVGTNSTADSYKMYSKETATSDAEKPKLIVTEKTLSNQTLAFEDDIKLSIYPNPTNSKLYIKYLNSQDTVSLYTINGQLVSSQKYKSYIDVASLNPGLYYISITNKNGKGYVPFIKK